MPDFIPLVRRSYQAYVDKDRPALEALIADDFHFTSPLDNRIDRAVYFDRCWPNSQTISDFQFVHLVQHGDRVFVTYESRGTVGKCFRNTEILTVRGDKIVEAEVYFGWTIPHEASFGGYVNS
jgi:ketosteroid isomerase-like protein